MLNLLTGILNKCTSLS